MASNRKFLLLCAFVVGAVAVPVSKREQCARYCTEEGDFSLRPGSTYTYNYETTTTTAVQGSSQDKTQIQLTAQVDIEVISKCDLSLRLRGVTLKQSDPESPDYLYAIRGARDFARSVETNILRFSFQNGKVEHVCPTEDAPVWVTNIQKGVLSAFQTFMLQPDWSTRVVETDILGKCMADYQSLGTNWQGTHTIRKLKDLTTCTERENVDTYLQGTPYTEDFQSKSLPLVKGSQECEQVLGQGFLQSSTCREKLVFRPFSNGGSSVVTSVVQKLSYATVSQRSFTGNDYRPTTETLLYRHAAPEENPSRQEEEAEATLKELCDASEQDISITVPRQFSAFVYKLKKLNLGSLRSFYQKIDRICPKNTKSRKFFMDAIPMVATYHSAKFMYDMISTNAISENEINFWLTSLSFVNEPTADIITTFTPLLDGRYEQALLGVSALIHTYCKSHDCAEKLEVKEAVSTLFKNLGQNCFNANDKKIIMTLKAISNIGYTYGNEEVLQMCYKNPQIRMETRIAAIQAYRRVNCGVSRDDLMMLYSNYNEDPEIRIAAYLAVMACPNINVIQSVRSVLMEEKINHIGSFVWTHLKALSKTRHPQKQDIRDIVSILYLLDKYESDAKKFSTAREASFFLESIDSGFHVDSHLIYSTDSYLPRSAMFNLTVDVFGKTCNLFQIDGRMEGLEHVVESFFGPSGYFPQKNIAKMLREKRSLSYNKIQELDKKFQAKARFQQSPYGSLDVKIFGTTLWYNQFKDSNDGNPDINLLEVVTKLAEEQESEDSRSFMFLDTTFTVPMTSGMPLRIAVNGTASVTLKFGGKFDVKSFEHVDVIGHIEPSGAVEIASLLTIEAGNAARSGLRVVGTMHSSTVLDGRLEIRNGEVVKAQLNMPRDRIDIFNIQSKLFLVHGSEEREPKVDKKGETNIKSCTGSMTRKIFGIELCSELRLPPYKPNTALHPVNGPANFNIYIQKTDPQLKSYTFDAEWKLELKNGAFVRHGILALNTPNSQVDRDVKMEFNINHADHTATLKMKTPMKRLEANAKLVNEKDLKKMVLGLTVDDKDYFTLQSELRTINDKSAVTYQPSLEIRIPSRRLTSVSGSLYLKHGQKYTGQLQIEDLTDKPILAKGNLEVGKKDRYDGELSLNSFVFDGTIKGYAQLGDSMTSRITAEYKFLEGKTNKINVMSKLRNLSANALQKYNGLLNIQASLLPEWNTELAFETMRTTGHIENTVSIQLGDGVRSRVHNIRLQEILTYQGNLKNNKVDGKLSLVYPEKNIDYAIQVNHENTEKSLKNTLKVQYDTNQDVTTDVQLRIEQSTPFSASGDLKLKYPGRNAALSASVAESNPKEYSASVSCQWQEGRQASAMITYKDKTDSTHLKYEVEGEINMPLKRPITFTTTVGTQRGQFAASAEVSMGMDKYRLKADYTKGNGFNHRASGQLILNNNMYGLDAAMQLAKNKANCNIEVKMPNRHRVTAKFDGKMGEFLKTAVIETLWDADRDTSKRFGLNGELRNHADGYEGKVIMQVLRRTITGSINTGMKGQFLGPQWSTNNKIELEWSPTEKATASFVTNLVLDKSRQDVNSQIEITTPYDNYKNLTMSIVHMFANQQWETELSTVLPRYHQISLGTSGRYSFARGATIEGRVKLQTTFSHMRVTQFEITHDHSAKELTSKAQLLWGSGKRMTLDASGVSQPSVYRGSLKFTSPFRNFEDLSTEVIHNYEPHFYRTRCEFQWAHGRKVAVNFEGKHVLSGRRRLCTIVLSGTSPFQDFENTAAKISYSNDGINLNTDIELNWSDRKKISSSFTGSLRNSPSLRNIESKFQFTSPFKNYENFEISSSLEANRNSYKVNVDAQLPHRSKASLNSQGKMTNLNDIELNAVLTANIPRYMKSQRASIDFVHKLQPSKLRSTLDTVYNDNRLTVLLTGLFESSYDSRNIEFSATVNTPFDNYKEVKCDLTHTQRGYEYITKFEGNKNEVSGILIHKISARDLLNFETTFEATSSVYPTTKISITQMKNEGHLEHNSVISWDKNKRINFNALYIDKSFAKEFSVKFTSPFRKFRELEMKSSYENQNWDHKAIISVVMDRRTKVTLSGNMRNYRWRNVNAQLEFSSSFRDHEFYATTFKYDLTAPQKSIEASYSWDGANRKAVALKGNFMHSYSLTNAELEVTTPYRDFNRISISGKRETTPEEANVNMVYERDGKRIACSGRLVMHNNRAQINFDATSTYPQMRSLKFLAKYDHLNEGMTGEISADWNRVNKYQTKGEYKFGNKALSGKISFLTPIEGYRNVDIQTNVNYGGSRKSGELSVKWDNDNLVLINSEYDIRRDGRGINVNILSSFENYAEISLSSWYKTVSGFYEAETKIMKNKEVFYESNIALQYGGDHLLDGKLNLNYPSAILKTFKLTGTVDSKDGFKQITATMNCNGKESTLNAVFKREGDQFFEVKAEINTAYDSFRHFNLESSLRRNSYRFIDARLKMATPIEMLRTLDMYSEIKVDDSGCFVTFSLSTPKQKITVEGKISNRQFHPFTAALEVDAPFLSFRKISTNIEINIVSWNNAKVALSLSSPKFKHAFSALYMQDDDDFDFHIKVESTALKSGSAILSAKANYENSNNIESEASLQLFGHVHYMNGQLIMSSKSTEVQIRMESPLLPERKLEAFAVVSRKRRGNTRGYEGKLGLTFSSSTHELSAKYENKGSQISADLKVDSSFWKTSLIDAQARYTNSNDKDLEASFTLTTPDASHSIIGSLKNYDSEKFVQFKVECPMVDFLNSFTITGTLKHDGFESMDGSLSIATGRKELRIAVNMKKDGWKNMEAFVTVNTPFEVLRMFRVDGRFRNEKFKNIDCNFQIETSNGNFPSLGVTSKISRTKGSEEISVMLHLPIRNYRSIQVLANAHYEADFSSADSRITLTIPPKRYSISGQYSINDPRISGTAELEYDGKKWAATGRLEHASGKNDVSLSFTTPSSERYNFGGAYGKSGSRYFVAGSYVSPYNEKYDVNTSMSFNDYKNFEVAVKVETPFDDFRNIEGSINQQYSSNLLSTYVECLRNGRRGFLKIIRRNTRNSAVGSIQISSPYSQLRDIKLSSSHQKKPRDQEYSLELDWNRVKQFKAELIQFGDRSSHVILDIPVLPMTMTANSKLQSNGREIDFKTDYNSRIVGFKTSYQRSSGEFLHDASFAWDDKADKRISYDFKLVQTATGKELWSRLDTPIRSFMLKGNFTNSNRARSGGIDFYWDASRSLEKHMAVGVEHADMSSGRKTSHRIQIKVEHPKLTRDIIQTNVISFGPNEFQAKSELTYSRQRHHNLLMEVKANDLSRNDRGSHYKGEFTLRHPISKIDVRANGEVMNSRLDSSLNLQINSIGADQVSRVQEIKATLSKIMQQFEVMVRSDADIKNILGQINNRNGELVVFVEIKKNEVKQLSTLLKLNSRSKSMEFSVINSENTGVHAAASFPKESASVKLSHSKKGDVVTDVNLYLTLEQSKILKSQLNWRPKMWKELRITTGENLRAFAGAVRERYTSTSSSLSTNLKERITVVSQNMYEQLVPFVDEISFDISEMKRDLRSVRSSFVRMYKNNEFYMQDIVLGCEEALEVAKEVIDGLGLGYEVLCNIIIEYTEELYFSLYYTCLDVTEYLQERYTEFVAYMYRCFADVQICMSRYARHFAFRLERCMEYMSKKVQELSDEAIIRIDKMVRGYAPCIIDCYYYILNTADMIRATVNRMYNSVSDYIGSNRYYIALKKYAANVADTVQAFRDYEYTEAAQEFFNNIYDAELLGSIINHPNVEYMSGLANTALRKSVQLYHNLGLDIVVASVADTVTNYAKEVALNAVQEILSDMYEMKGGAKYEFAPDRGYMAFEMNLPGSRDSLIEVFDLRTYPEYRKVKEITDNFSGHFYEDFCIWDFYYKAMKYFSLGYWLPSFTGHAIIAGNQHYITFDKRSYEFAGKCSYLLARDFVDGNFSVIVNYGDDHLRKSLTVLTDGKKVDIGNDYKITVDDVKAESPLRIGHAVVIRQGSNIRIENDRKGFFVVCNFAYNYCSLSISGFYYGKTGGLFGTFNYEPELDMMTPTRHIAEDLERFTKSWEVGMRDCKDNENWATVPSNDYRVVQRCDRLFTGPTSEFRPCFRQVNPDPYRKMCISDLSAVHEKDFENVICQSAAAYFLKCKMEGITLKMPSSCVRCEKQDGSMMKEGEALQITRDTVMTAADVVFLIEEKECNKERVKYIGKLAQSIDDNFRQKGYREVRYSVVAFGGDDIHSAPHIHTMDGQETGSLRSLGSAIDSLEFGDGPVNILEALRFAASLNFRPGTTKTFVLMKCSTCKSEEVKAEYSEMLRTLMDGDISLHLLMEQKYDMKVPSKIAKARKVIGVDKNVAFTLKDVKEPQFGDGDLLVQLKIPKDVCIPLAFEVNGSSFDVQFLTDTKKNTNKKFIDVMARRIVRPSYSPSSQWGMCCECIATADGVGKSTCQRCVSAEIANMISAETAGVNMIPASKPEKDAPKRRVRKHKDRKSGQ